MTETAQLSEQARRDYGDLVARIDTWPPGLGIDVHLIGGDLVQYLPDGTRYIVDQSSGRTRMRRAVAALRGWARSLRTVLRATPGDQARGLQRQGGDDD